MEISEFFLSEKTLLLRKNFLENLKTRIESILEDLALLKANRGGLDQVENSFQETHRIKGAGGTYGFLEATIVAKNAIQFLRPFFNEKKITPPEYAEKSYNIFTHFLNTTYPDLLKNMQLLFNANNSPVRISLLLEYNNNREFLDYLQLRMMDDNTSLFSSAEALESMKLPVIIQPDIILRIDNSCAGIKADCEKAIIFIPNNIADDNLYKILLDKIHYFHVKCS